MNPALLRLTWRHINRRFLQSLLFVIGIALGVAVGVGIDIANSSASRAFDLSVDTITGRTTHQIVSSGRGLPLELYQQIRTEIDISASAPIIESYVRAASLDNRTLRLLGVDPVAEASFRSYLIPDTFTAETSSAAYAFVTRPNTALIGEGLAEQFDLQIGDILTLQTQTNADASVKIAGVLSPNDEISQQALDNLLITTILTAQAVAGEPGIISRIDLIVPENYDLSPIEAILPSGVIITTPAARSGALRQMTAAFELNLQALSLLALLVGVFLIYNTVTFSVVQRRPVIGILRSLGTTRRQIFSLILTEALVLGLIGTVLGLGLGIVLGQGIVRLVAQTINDLYFRVNVENITIETPTLLRGVIIGIAASLLAALIPSYEAKRTPPAGVLQRSVIEQRTRRLLPLVTLSAIVLSLAGFAVLQIPTDSVPVSFLALFLILIGCALFTPLALLILMRFAGMITGPLFGVLGQMAPRTVIRSLSRTAIAVTALTLAVSVIVGVSIMISSFRGTITEWLNTTLGADIFISPFAGNDTAAIDVDIDPAILTGLQALDGVARVTSVRSVSVLAPDYPDLPPVYLVAPDADITDGARRFVWKTFSDEDYWNQLLAGKIVVSEPFAFRRNITQENNTLTLLTDQGEHTFTIEGVYYDYTTDQGAVMMHANVYRQYFDDPYLSAIALDLEPDTDLATVLNTLQTDTLVGTGLEAQSNRALRASVLEIFDRTFSITITLRLLATIVAFIGILSTLLALQFEHTQQYGIMRANGMTPRQLRTFTLVQTGLMGTAAGILALPIGLILALILVYSINVRSFGWTMTLMVTPQEFIQAFAIALIAALIAGIYPALRLSKLVTVQAIRSE